MEYPKYILDDDDNNNDDEYKNNISSSLSSLYDDEYDIRMKGISVSISKKDLNMNNNNNSIEGFGGSGSSRIIVKENNREKKKLSDNYSGSSSRGIYKLDDDDERSSEEKEKENDELSSKLMVGNRLEKRKEEEEAGLLRILSCGSVPSKNLMDLNSKFPVLKKSYKKKHLKMKKKKRNRKKMENVGRKFGFRINKETLLDRGTKEEKDVVEMGKQFGLESWPMFHRKNMILKRKKKRKTKKRRSKRKEKKKRIRKIENRDIWETKKDEIMKMRSKKRRNKGRDLSVQLEFKRGRLKEEKLRILSKKFRKGKRSKLPSLLVKETIKNIDKELAKKRNTFEIERRSKVRKIKNQQLVRGRVNLHFMRESEKPSLKFACFRVRTSDQKGNSRQVLLEDQRKPKSATSSTCLHYTFKRTRNSERQCRRDRNNVLFGKGKRSNFVSNRANYFFERVKM